MPASSGASRSSRGASAAAAAVLAVRAAAPATTAGDAFSATSGSRTHAKGAPAHAAAASVHSRCRPTSTGSSTSAAFAAVATASLLRAGSAAAGRASRTGRAQGPKQEAAAVSDKVALAEVERLLSEAARLRQGAAELEAAKAERQLEERKRWFKVFDSQQTGAVDVEGLRRGIKEFCGEELDESMALRLLQAHDRNQDGKLHLEEFDIEGFQRSLDKFRKEDREREDAEDARRREEKEKEEDDALVKAFWAKLPDVNEDTGILARLFAVAAWFLPLLDVMRYAIPLGKQLPVVQAFLGVMVVPLQAMNRIPFSELIVFLIMQVVATQKDVPLLTRFNMRLAIFLDIAIFVPNFIQWLAKITVGQTGAALPEELVFVSSTLVFVLVAGIVAYCVACSLLGVMPNAVPYLSDAAAQSLGPKAASKLGVEVKISVKKRADKTRVGKGKA